MSLWFFCGNRDCVKLEGDKVADLSSMMDGVTCELTTLRDSFDRACRIGLIKKRLARKLGIAFLKGLVKGSFDHYIEQSCKTLNGNTQEESPDSLCISKDNIKELALLLLDSNRIVVGEY